MSVADNLRAMSGVWHDHLDGYGVDGTVLPEDPFGGTPGPFPYDNLVYVDFDGETYRQTNVTFAGRPLHVRSFTGRLVEGVLEFDVLGPEDPGHVGVSGGPGLLVFLPRRLDAAPLQRFSDPDVITFDAHARRRITTLYRHSELVRVLNVTGVRVSDDPSRRIPWDPRGADGPVHAERSVTQVYTQDKQG